MSKTYKKQEKPFVHMYTLSRFFYHAWKGKEYYPWRFGPEYKAATS
jgi:hypothetical protein